MRSPSWTTLGDLKEQAFISLIDSHIANRQFLTALSAGAKESQFCCMAAIFDCRRRPAPAPPPPSKQGSISCAGLILLKSTGAERQLQPEKTEQKMVIRKAVHTAGLSCPKTRLAMIWCTAALALSESTASRHLILTPSHLCRMQGMGFALRK